MTSFQLSAPALISLETADGLAVKLDPYTANEWLAECNKKFHGDDQAAGTFLKTKLAELFGCQPSAFAMNQVTDFAALITATVKQLDEERKKKLDSIANLPPCILESRPISEAGPNTKNGLGSTITPELEPNLEPSTRDMI